MDPMFLFYLTDHFAQSTYFFSIIRTLEDNFIDLTTIAMWSVVSVGSNVYAPLLWSMFYINIFGGGVYKCINNITSHTRATHGESQELAVPRDPSINKQTCFISPIATMLKRQAVHKCVR